MSNPALAPIPRPELWKIIGASSAGTLIEWYDFYIFASLAAVVSGKFFPDGDGVIGFLKTLAVIWVGFAVRPFGAIFFGALGDIIGRKHTFLVTLLIMGGATFGIGVMPTYADVGVIAPVLLLVLRVLQGLALGGEYGGAATYIAEHSPDGERGFWTGWIQTTATLGLFVSLGVILTCRLSMDAEAFNQWGWRIPFLLSIILVVFSYFLRLRMKESPIFQRMKAAGKVAKNPVRESFGNWYNLKFVLIALFGAAAGQGVVWYTGQFYALFFLQKTANIELVQSTVIIGAALLVATPFFVMMGSLSDRIGRKPIIMLGCLLAVLTYIPIFKGIYAQADLSRKTPAATAAAVLLGEPTTRVLEQADKTLEAGVGDTVTVTRHTLGYTDGTTAVRTTTRVVHAGGERPEKVVIAHEVHLGTGPMIITMGLVCILVTYVTMVYGPIAALLVEMFPTRIRYTSMSLPYHIGNGVFGGLVPFAATWISSYTIREFPESSLKLYAGLFYPMAIALLTLVVGSIFIKDRRGVKMWDEAMDDSR